MFLLDSKISNMFIVTFNLNFTFVNIHWSTTCTPFFINSPHKIPTLCWNYVKLMHYRHDAWWFQHFDWDMGFIRFSSRCHPPWFLGLEACLRHTPMKLSSACVVERLLAKELHHVSESLYLLTPWCAGLRWRHKILGEATRLVQPAYRICEILFAVASTRYFAFTWGSFFRRLLTRLLPLLPDGIASVRSGIRNYHFNDLPSFTIQFDTLERLKI